MKNHAGSLGLFALALASAHAAQPVTAQEAMLPPDSVCAASPIAGEDRTVDPRLLIRYLVSVGGLTDAALDANGDGDTLLAEKQLALVQTDYCTTEAGRSCTKEDSEALLKLQSRLQQFVKVEGGPGFAFERLRRPTAQERAQSRVLETQFEQAGQDFQVGELLDLDQRFVKVSCVVPEGPAATAKAAPVESGDPSALVDATPRPHWVFNADDEGGIRLTGEVDDLNKDRGTLGAVKPAEFSITADLDDDITRYQVKAIAGYDIQLDRGPNIYTSTIPFVLIERFFDGGDNEIDKLGFGFQQAVRFVLPDLASSEFAITPIYLTDSDFDSDIGLLKFRWTPTTAPASGVPLGFPATFGPVVLQTDLDLLTDVGWVFDTGDNDDLEDDEFWRIGGRFGIRLRGAPGTYFDQIELAVTNKYLLDLDEEPEDFYLLDAAISYLFSSAANYQLSFSYANGQTDDTLEPVHYWKTQFGVRF